MTAYFTSRNAAIAAAGGLVAALLFSGVAQAITDTVFRYSPVKTGHYTIDHFALHPINSSVANEYSHGLNEGLVSNSAVGGCFNGGINLPHGATITDARVWYTSGVGVGDPVVAIFKQRLSDGARLVISQHLLTDNSVTRKAVNIPVAGDLIVNNAAFSYAIRVCLTLADSFYAARIGYSYANAGD